MSAQTLPSLKPRQLAILAVPAFLCALAGPGAADDAVPLQPITVTADAISDGAVGMVTSPATQYQVDQAGITQWGDAGGTNPYRAVSGMPSVNAQSADAYGLANIPGGAKGLRVRGELATHGVNGSTEGIPTNGVNPGAGQLFLYDAEDIASVTLSQGPVVPDSLAMFTTSGALNSNLRWPTAARDFQVSQSLGSFDFTRSFARLDSGALADGTALFASASHSSTSKWRGPGDSPDGRDNVEAAVSHPLGNGGDFKLYAAYNDMKEDNYAPLTFAQASNLGSYRTFDFTSTSSANPSKAVNYYGYNRQAFQDWSVISELSWKLSGDSKLVFKPFYQNENGYYLDGQSNPSTNTYKVRDWLLDHDSYGLTADFLTRINETNLKVGYWWTSMIPPGPPTAWKMYTPTAAGDLSGAASWAILAKETSRHQFNSLYATADRRFGGLQAEGGLRYVKETMPGLDFYNTTGIGNVSYDQAISQSKGVISERSASSFSREEVLPFLALGYELTPATTLKGSIGRNYGAPSFDIWPVYQQNYATFHAKGITADQLWHGMKPETADAVDLGLRMNSAQGWFEPTVYYSRNHNKAVAYDPGLGVAYSQNVGETRAWGAQATASWSPLTNLDVFGSLSWDHDVFAQDLPMNNGGSQAVTGLQLPDVPLLSANLGTAWHQGGFTVSPLLHYMGSRFGDTQHMQKVPGYATMDLSLDYKKKLSFGKLDASLTVANLFDKQYIGFINASYYQLLSNSSAYYYPGAPRSLVAKISIDF